MPDKPDIALAPSGGEDLAVTGFRASGLSCGIKKKKGRKDLALIVSDVDATVAGVFTTNRVRASSVDFDKVRVGKKVSRGVIVNSGNANACTGPQGAKDTLRMATAVEKALGFKRGAMLVSSTGVIGVPLPVEKIEAAVPELAGGLRPDGLMEASEAIMTTDAFAKYASDSVRIGRSTVKVTGIAKGAGMICPNMATMLAYFLTDARIDAAALKSSLKSAVESSFNSIIVDNDTSTNDMALVFANGLAKGPVIKPGTAAHRKFTALVTGVAEKLAKMIVRDGEGATRLIEINVKGAASEKAAKKAARTVAESYLVKSAFFGGDPNWGRIIAALGRSGVKVVEGRTDISFNGVKVVSGGLDTGRESAAAAALKASDVRVVVDMGLGSASAIVWTSDLTYEYVKINSAYRT